jgi:hypothetical protein
MRIYFLDNAGIKHHTKLENLENMQIFEVCEEDNTEKFIGTVEILPAKKTDQ